MQVLADRYELGEPVGAGGMARVLRAHDLVLERPVAVKLLREDIASDDEVRDRFLREARTAAQFNHPNAVAVFDSGSDDGDPWIVMELVQGEDLSQRIRRTGPLDESEAVGIADCVLAALEAAHREGFVHRDVKPANIMLLDDGSVKLADFGIAKSVQDAASNITGTGQIIGTARYLAPEQVSGRPTTAASDVYAMGIVLYEMLAGQAPYTGSDPISVAVAHTREPVPDLAAALPHVSGDLAAVITRALAKDPAHRYADAGELRHALLGDTRPQPLPFAAAGATAGTTAAGATAVLPAGAAAPTGPAGTRTIALDDDAPTLDPAAGTAPAAPTAPRRLPWLLLALLAAAVVALLALVAAGLERTPPEITTDAGAAEQSTADETDDAGADDAEVEPPADSGGGEANARPAPEPKAAKEPKGKAKGKNKDKGKKD
jgi:eukaryotic-like serine/threonine-protein kinase